MLLPSKTKKQLKIDTKLQYVVSFAGKIMAAARNMWARYVLSQKGAIHIKCSKPCIYTGVN